MGVPVLERKSIPPCSIPSALCDDDDDDDDNGELDGGGGGMDVGDSEDTIVFVVSRPCTVGVVVVVTIVVVAVTEFEDGNIF